LKSEQLEGSGLKIPRKNRSPPKAAPGVITGYFQNSQNSRTLCSCSWNVQTRKFQNANL
jgi:hypothetical protein